mmetsp:Transcript_13272/g.36664  ORF Transcript_13272/g.36664 Transcript_13272/m.36664 type:complete len:347 (-) Transcript_13272:345-1385(-)
MWKYSHFIMLFESAAEYLEPLFLIRATIESSRVRTLDSKKLCFYRVIMMMPGVCLLSLSSTLHSSLLRQRLNIDIIGRFVAMPGAVVRPRILVVVVAACHQGNAAKERQPREIIQVADGRPRSLRRCDEGNTEGIQKDEQNRKDDLQHEWGRGGCHLHPDNAEREDCRDRTHGDTEQCPSAEQVAFGIFPGAIPLQDVGGRSHDNQGARQHATPHGETGRTILDFSGQIDTEDCAEVANEQEDDRDKSCPSEVVEVGVDDSRVIVTIVGHQSAVGVADDRHSGCPESGQHEDEGTLEPGVDDEAGVDRVQVQCCDDEGDGEGDGCACDRPPGVAIIVALLIFRLNC